LTVSLSPIDHAAALRDDVRERKRRVEHERRMIQQRLAELRAVCDELGIDFQAFRSEGSAQGPGRDRQH